MSGGDDRPVPSFGRSLDDWRRCHADGCEWRTINAYWCQEHGGRSPHVEFRYTPSGGYEERPGIRPDVVTSPLRSDGTR